MVTRKVRSVSYIAIVAAFTSTCQESHGFSLSPAHNFHSIIDLRQSRNSGIMMQSDSDDNSRNMPQHSLLDRDEEQTLLTSAHEYTRLNKLKVETHLRIPNSASLSSLQQKENFLLLSGYMSVEELDQSIQEGRMARETLITSNMGLVHSITKQILSSSTKKLQTLTYDDLIQEGSIGLSRAIDKYTFSYNTKFGTYAYYWIRAAILRALAEKNEYIRIPEHVSATVSKISKAIKLGAGSSDDIVSDWAWKEVNEAKKLAESVGEKVDKVDRAMEVEKRRRRGMVVLMGSKQLDVDKEDNTMAFEENNKEELKKMLETHLKPKEARALCLRYGLIDADQKFRDYEAEAEMDLFGPEGILSSSDLVTKSTSTRNGSKKNMIPSQILPIRKVQPTRGKWGEAMTFKEIGKQMAISAENGRRLCSVGLEKLRAAVEEGKLDPGLLY